MLDLQIEVYSFGKMLTSNFPILELNSLYVTCTMLDLQIEVRYYGLSFAEHQIGR